MGNLISIQEVCKRYKVTRKTLYNWQAASKIVMIKKSGKTYVNRAEIDRLAVLRSEVPITQHDTDLHSEIKLLSNKIEQLESVITQLSTQLLQRNTSKEEKSQEVTQQITQPEKEKSSQRPYDAKRTKELIKKCRSVFTQLDLDVQSTITKKDFAKLAGVSRGSVTRHWNEIVTK